MRWPRLGRVVAGGLVGLGALGMDLLLDLLRLGHILPVAPRFVAAYAAVGALAAGLLELGWPRRWPGGGWARAAAVLAGLYPGAPTPRVVAYLWSRP